MLNIKILIYGHNKKRNEKNVIMYVDKLLLGWIQPNKPFSLNDAFKYIRQVKKDTYLADVYNAIYRLMDKDLIKPYGELYKM